MRYKLNKWVDKILKNGRLNCLLELLAQIIFIKIVPEKFIYVQFYAH